MISYCKLVCDCFKYGWKEIISNYTKCRKQMLKIITFIWNIYNESTGEMKLMMKFYPCSHNLSEIWNLFSRIPRGNCFWCYFRQIFVTEAFRKCRKYLNILKIILVQDLCPLKTEIARFRATKTSEKDMFSIAVASFQRPNKQVESERNNSFYVAFWRFLTLVTNWFSKHKKFLVWYHWLP